MGPTPEIAEVMLRRWAEDDLRTINGLIEYLLTDQARRAGRLSHRRARPAQPPAEPPAQADEDEDTESTPSDARVFR